MANSKSSKNTPAAGELSGLLKQADSLHKAMEQAQEDLGQEVVEGRDPTAKVVVRVRGDGVPDSVQIPAQFLEGRDVEAVQDAIVTAMRGALEKMFALRRKRLSEVTKGMNLPNLYT